jgi:hypothetical protein
VSVNTPNSGTFQQQISDATVALRNDFQTLKNLNDYIIAEGGSTWLANTVGIAAPDAAVIVSTLGNLAALEAIYRGGTPGAAFDYRTNSNLLWGGK